MIGLLSLAALAATSEIPHDRPGDVLPDRHWDVEHLDLTIELPDPQSGVGLILGTTRHTVHPLGAPYGTIRLHQADLKVSEIRVDDAVVEGWRQSQDALEIPMPTTGDTHTVEVHYSATPQTGLHFRLPKGDSDPVWEVWSQGEDTDNRYWFPGWDHPSDRFTVTTHAIARDGLEVVANGSLVDKTPARPGWTRWTYTLDRPIVNYLVALAAGDYRVVRDEGPVPLEYISASTHDEAMIRRGFEQAKPQMAYYQELLDEPFPYPVYRQVMVSRFLYGGMENAGLTVMSDAMLQPDPNGRTLHAEQVAAHELAHQWFGDLLTCYGWRDLWLNEGFATFYTGRWMEHSRGEALYAAKVRGWMGEARGVQNPMAPRGWSAVPGSDNEGVYERGASVLHMLRVYLSDEVFDAGIRLYIDRNADRLVESEDLRRALEDVSGTHLGWFFDQWVHQGGAPDLSSSWRWAEGELVVTVAQTTEGTAFWAPIEIEVGSDPPTRRRIWLGEGEARLVLVLEQIPRWVSVDPRSGVLARWEHHQDPSQWVAQALESPTPGAQLEAIAQLAKAPAETAVPALVRLLNDHALEPRIRESVARSLGALSTAEAAGALQAALVEPDPYLRGTIAEALGQTELAPSSRAALVQLHQSDPDAGVRAAAIEALTQMDKTRALGLARKTLGAPDRSWQMRVHQAALDALGTVAERQDLPLLIDRTRPRWPSGVRRSAAWAATRLIQREEGDWAESARSRLSERLIEDLRDADQRSREGAIGLLGMIGDDRAEDALERFAAHNTVQGFSDLARDAAAAIRGRAASESDEAPPSNADVERLEQDLDDLRERLERLEQWR